MRYLSRAEAEVLLRGVGLRIGNWNQLVELAEEAIESAVYHPPRDALQLYSVASRLAKWIARDGWILLQIDNSTSPATDEVRVFETLLLAPGRTWDVGGQRSFLLNETALARSENDWTSLELLVLFSLLFGWHVHLTSEHASKGQRIALQDGVVCFYGEALALHSAHCLIAELDADPLRIG